MRHVMASCAKPPGIFARAEKAATMRSRAQPVRKRWAPEVKAPEASIEESLVAVFGHRTIEYNRYRSAAQLDHGPPSSCTWVCERHITGDNRGSGALVVVRRSPS
jgi:hypothetical protein